MIKNILIDKPFCKIIATLGPDTSTEEKIEKLVLAGVSVFRFNCSHGSEPEYKERITAIRKMEQKYNCSLGVLFDLQGPKLRIGTFKNGSVVLKEGQKFTLDMSEEPGDETRVPLQHPEVFSVMKPGLDLLINDGAIRVRIESCDSSHALTTVIAGGPLSNRKGVNVPQVSLPISAITDKDKADLKLAESMGADFIGLSFVQSADDVKRARSLMTSKANIIAKIEKQGAIDDLRNIIDEADAVMVARGDLGVELGPETVPVHQKRIISGCRKAGKPVIVATQMLESMINSPVPTRAEASDVATAVYEGADAVMLSAETANGRFPVEAVSTMNKIISTVEHDKRFKRTVDVVVVEPGVGTENAITAAAAAATESISASVIVNFTTSGATTIRTARQRPGARILSLSPYIDVARKMALVWGVTSLITPHLNAFTEIPREARAAVLLTGYAKEGDKIIITAGVPFATQGTTNLMYVVTV